MAISKVTLNNEVLMDVTQDTVASSNLLDGYTATGADGEPVEGALTFITQAKTATPTESQQVIKPDSGNDGLSQVTVGAISKTYVGSSVPRKSSANLTVSDNNVTAPAGYYASDATATVPTIALATPSVSLNTSTGLVTATVTQNAGYVDAGEQSGTKQLTVQAAKTVTPTEAEQTAVAAGKYTTGAVKVAAISSTYVGSGVARNDSSDITVSGANVTVAQGYYDKGYAVSVASGSAKTPATTITVTPGISVNTSTGVVTATASGSKSVTPTVTAGYVSAGTAGTVSVSGSNTYQLTTQAAMTITPGSTEQTAVAAGRFTTGAVKVAAVPDGDSLSYGAAAGAASTSSKVNVGTVGSMQVKG